MKKYLNYTLLLLALLGFSACSSTALNKTIDEKLAQESVSTNAELRQENKKYMEEMAGISMEQRAKLAELQKAVRESLDADYKQSVKLRSLLVKEVISTSYNVEEVELIKRRIKKIENHRTATMFDAVDSANMILGRHARDHGGIMSQFLDPFNNGRVNQGFETRDN